MSDALILSGGGYTSVATDELFIEATRVAQCASRADSWFAVITNILVTDAGASSLGPELESTRQLESALTKTQQLADDARVAGAALMKSADSYGDTERRLTSLLGFGAQYGGWSLGSGHLLGILALLGTVSTAGLALLASTMLGIPMAKMAAYLAIQLKKAPGLMNSPLFVRLVRSVVSSSDEMAFGAAGVPAGLALLFGRALGARDGAAALAALAKLASGGGKGPLVETGQRVTSVGTPRGVEPPHTVGELAERVPSSGGDSPQVRVERYGSEADPRWVVYIAGTGDFSLTPQSDSFDMTSNIHATAGGDAASERAVRDALTAAGAKPGDPLLPIGHSQGGLLAAMLAQDPDMNVVGYVSMGGPVGSVTVADVPGVSIEHTEDLVPALGGTAKPSDSLVTVGRSVLDNAAESAPLAVHGLDYYRETASLISASDESRLQDFDQLVSDFTGTEKGVETRWRAGRLPEVDASVAPAKQTAPASPR